MTEHKFAQHDRVTRIEIIDATGRAFVEYYDAPGATVHVQDEGRTLKVFLTGKGVLA